ARLDPATLGTAGRHVYRLGPADTGRRGHRGARGQLQHPGRRDATIRGESGLQLIAAAPTAGSGSVRTQFGANIRPAMSDRMKKLAFLILAATGLAGPAFAQLQLTITSGVTDPIPIAVVPFARAVPADGGLDVAGVVQRDLESTGRFTGMTRKDMVFKPPTAAEVDAPGWKQQHNDYVVVGRVSALADGQVRI